MIKIELMELDSNKKLVKVADKVLKPAERTASQWIEEVSRAYDKENEFFKMSSQFVIDDRTSGGYMPKGALFFFTNKGNNIGSGVQNCYFINARAKDNGTKCIPIFPENFVRANVALVARTTIPHSWHRDRDEFSVPSQDILESDEYSQFTYTALVYNIFSSYNHLNSFEHESFDIKNEFFFIKKDEVLEFLEKERNFAEYSKLQHEEDRFVAKVLDKAIQDGLVTGKAKQIIDLAKEIYKLSYKGRASYSPSPETNGLLQANRWDLGWKQLRLIIEDMSKSGNEELAEKYKEFQELRSEIKQELVESVDRLDFYGQRELFINE